MKVLSFLCRADASVAGSASVLPMQRLTVTHGFVVGFQTKNSANKGTSIAGICKSTICRHGDHTRRERYIRNGVDTETSVFCKIFVKASHHQRHTDASGPYPLKKLGNEPQLPSFEKMKPAHNPIAGKTPWQL